MPRRARFCPAGLPVHLIQRGNNRQVLFTCDADLAAYANWLADGAERYGVSVHGWVFMTNHVHLLATPANDDSLSRLMQFLGRLYVRHFNYTYQRSGTLFEGRFKSCVVQDDQYLLSCLRYIELNPVRAGMVSDPGEYVWSSFRAHAFGTWILDQTTNNASRPSGILSVKSWIWTCWPRFASARTPDWSWVPRHSGTRWTGSGIERLEQPYSVPLL